MINIYWSLNINYYGISILLPLIATTNKYSSNSNNKIIAITYIVYYMPGI